MFAQDSTLVGDVDCSGEVNSQDASLILQFVTNVIDSLPCEANMTGLTPEQLQEMIDMMSGQLNVDYTGSFPIEGWIDHDYQATFCCSGWCWGTEWGGGCPDNPIVNTATNSGIVYFTQHSACDEAEIYINGNLISEIDEYYGNETFTFPVKKGDEFIIYNTCSPTMEEADNALIPASVNAHFYFYSFGDEDGESSNTNNNGFDGNNPSNGVLDLSNICNEVSDIFLIGEFDATPNSQVNFSFESMFEPNITGYNFSNQSHSLLEDLDGNFYVLGVFDSNSYEPNIFIGGELIGIENDNQQNKFFISKFNSNGETLWTKQSLSFDSDGFCFKGNFDNDGNLVLVLSIDQNDPNLTNLFDQEISEELVVLKLSSSGEVLNLVNLPASNSSNPSKPAFDSDNNIYLFGDNGNTNNLFKIYSDFTYDLIDIFNSSWISFGGPDIVIDEENNIIIMVTFSGSNVFADYIIEPGATHLLKFDNDFNIIWANILFDNNNYEISNNQFASLVNDSNNNIYIEIPSSSNQFILKYSKEGNLLLKLFSESSSVIDDNLNIYNDVLSTSFVRPQSKRLINNQINHNSNPFRTEFDFVKIDSIGVVTDHNYLFETINNMGEGYEPNLKLGISTKNYILFTIEYPNSVCINGESREFGLYVIKK